MQTIAGVVQKPLDAQRMIDELTSECLCDRSDITVLVRDGEGWIGQAANQAGGGVKQSIDNGTAAARTVIDMLSQGTESISRSIPGGGVLRTFGAMGTAVANAAVAGGAELAKALIDSGVPRNSADFYSGAFDRGDILVTVQARSDKMAQCAQKIMMKYGAVAPESRAA
jgi:hypothetical protein